MNQSLGPERGGARTALDARRSQPRAAGVATHLSFPSVGHVAVAGDILRWVPAYWDY
jgi:hypothetical protein